MTAVAASAQTVPGQAGELLARLGDRAVVCDLYDQVGAPVYHDLAGSGTHEIRELLSLVRRFPGPVLDLAAGSGRLTMPLLALGREVTALDLSASMLRLLTVCLNTAPEVVQGRCEVVQADMSRFALHRKFGVIVLGTTSVSLLDQEGRTGMYRAVREHLVPDGRFMLTTVDLDGAHPGPAERIAKFTAASGHSYRMFEHWATGAPMRTVTIFPADFTDGPVTVCTTASRVLPAQRLEDELVGAGFIVHGRHALPPVGERHHAVLLEAGVAT